jgi:hypothetical protein
MLRWWERTLAAAAAALLVVLLVWLYWSPPERQVAVEGCAAENPAACVVTVSADPSAETAALVAASVVLLLIAILGVRFTTIKLPSGAELSRGAASETSPDTPARAKAAGRVAVAGIAPADDGTTLWSMLPEWAQFALYEWAAQNPVLRIPVTDAIESIHKPSRASDDPWYVHLDDGHGTTRTLRLTMGRGSRRTSKAAG